MKVITVFIVSFFSGIVCSQKKLDQKPTPCLVATIQRDSVLVKLKEYPTQVKMLEAYQKQLQSEYEFKKLELDTKVADYQEKEKTYSDQQKQEKIVELQKMDEVLKNFSKEAEQKLFQKENELLQPMNDKINKAIEAVALKQGYFQIIDKKFTYFSLPACDATKLVIDEANK